MLLSSSLQSLAAWSLFLLLGVLLRTHVDFWETPTFGSGSACPLHPPPLHSSSLLSFLFLFLPHSHPHSLPLFLPTSSPFTFWWKAGFFPWMALNSSSPSPCVLAVPTLPRNLSAATGSSVHMHIRVCVCVFRQFFVDIKLEMFAKTLFLTQDLSQVAGKSSGYLGASQLP